MKKQAFTLIEILVVATIIAILAAGAAISYASFAKQSRDAKRKSDLEQIRGAIEMYRSNVSGYPTAMDFSSCTMAALTDGVPNTYLSKIPNDPKCITYIYHYAALPNGCTNAVGNYCSDYTLGAYLETSTAVGACGSCSGAICNYCLGPYGQK